MSHTRSRSSGDQYPRTGERSLEAEKLPAKVSIEELERDDVVIAVMGPIGSGKSTFIRSASGLETHAVSNRLRSCTNEVVAVKFWDRKSKRRVVLVDTPGFDDAFKSDTDVLHMISEWLKSSYERNIRLSGILYFHRITDSRMTDTPLKNLRMFRELCGEDALKKVYFTTTMWDEVNEDIGETRLQELSRDYWNAMIDMGAQIARCRSDNDSSKELIRSIVLQKGERRTSPIQQEMKSGTRETSSGKQQPMKKRRCCLKCLFG